jgi:hypothetical protein
MACREGFGRKEKNGKKESKRKEEKRNVCCEEGFGQYMAVHGDLLKFRWHLL